MNTLFSFELSNSVSFFAAPGKQSHRHLMDGFKITSENAKEDDTAKTGDGDRDSIPGEKPEPTVKDKVD